MKHYYTLMCLLLAATLVGCGGGGSGDASGGGFDPRGAMVSAEKTQVVLEALSTDHNSPPQEIIKFAVSSTPDEGYTVGLLHTENGLFFVDFVATGEFTAELIISYPPANQLAPGVYEDTIEVLVCLDDFCDQQIAGSPITVTSSYVITDAYFDPRFSMKQIDTPARELVWNSEEMLMYATVPVNDGSISRALAVIDPVNGEIVDTVPLQHDPDQLAISHDNDYLYVGYRDLNEVHRFVLPDLVKDLTISLGDTGPNNFRPYSASDISAHPLDSNIVAVAREIFGAIRPPRNIVIFDGDVARPLYDSALPPDNSGFYDVLPAMVAWNDDGSEIYSNNRHNEAFNFYAFSVSSQGLTLITNTFETFSRRGTLGKLIYHSGEVIDPNGNLVDTETGAAIGYYTVDGYPSSNDNVTLSDDGEVVFTVNSPIIGAREFEVNSYSRSTLEHIQSIYIRDTIASPWGSMITLGSGGVAIASTGWSGHGESRPGGIVILEGSFFTPPELMEPTSRSHVSWKPAPYQQ